MSRAHPGRLRAAAVLAAALAACRSDRLAGPAELRLDPTAVLNSMAYTARLTSAAVAPGGLSPAAFGVTTTPGASVLAGFRGCAYDPAAREFRCLPETRQGITLTLVYAALDAAGAPLAGPTPETTAAVRTQLTAAGTSTSTLPDGRQAAVTLDQRHDATLRGFLGGPRVLDGDLVTRTQVATSGAPTMVLRSAQATRGLTFPSDGSYPSAGTVTTTLTDDAGAALLTQVLTFDGTGTATLVLTLAGGAAQRCTLDLAATAPAPRCAAAPGGA